MSERLQKIEGYLDRLPKDDAKWLVAEVRRLMKLKVELQTLVARQTAQIEARDKKIAAITDGVVRCPCNSPDDHAGWCPRRPE
jgi:hypothetical protein